jgi:bleomycin hydrolase
MGGQPSRMQLASAHEKAVVDRLHDLSMEDEEFDEKTLDGHALRNAEGLPINVLKSWQSDILSDPKNKLALTALRAANPRNVLTSGPILQADQQIFNIKIPFEGGPITNQRSSGRCWLFASTNVFRVALMKRYKLDSFELSQSYLFFWDKLEKSNWFLEQIIDTAGEDIEGRLVQALLGDIVSDGGQWDMVLLFVRLHSILC